jgi:hypothetical protein
MKKLNKSKNPTSNNNKINLNQIINISYLFQLNSNKNKKSFHFLKKISLIRSKYKSNPKKNQTLSKYNLIKISMKKVLFLNNIPIVTSIKGNSLPIEITNKCQNILNKVMSNQNKPTEVKTSLKNSQIAVKCKTQTTSNTNKIHSPNPNKLPH